MPAADRAELVDAVLTEADRLNRFVQNLLDMTRLGYGALQLRRDWVDLRELVGRAMERLRLPLAGHGVELDIPPDLPLLHVDPVLIEQVLVNLLDNAARYAPAGTAVRVGARRADGAIGVAVSDQGPGIPPADRERIFDMFYRVEAGDARRAGTGLGLAICRGLVEAHGGTIGVVAPGAGPGAIVEFSLPLANQPPVPEPAEEAVA